MRLPLLDAMVHPWVTVQGTVPLVPYNEPLNDEQLWDKVRQSFAKIWIGWVLIAIMGFNRHYTE